MSAAMRAIGALSVCAVVGACGAPQQQIRVEPSAPSRPGWIGSLPHEAGQVFVVGVASRQKTLEDGKAAAQASAAAQVASLVGVQVSSSGASRDSTERGTFAETSTNMHAAAVVKDLVLTDTYYEKSTKAVGSFYEESYDVWTLGRLPEASVAAERARQDQEAKEVATSAIAALQTIESASKSGKLGSAWQAATRARASLNNVPKDTKLGGAFATAGDVANAVESKWRELDQAAHSLRVELKAEGLAQKGSAALTSQLSEAAAKNGARMGEKAARFVLAIEASARVGDAKVMGQDVVYVTYAATLTDSWSAAHLPAASGEAKGFGKGPEGAAIEAAKEAAQKLGSEVGKAIATALAAEAK